MTGTIPTEYETLADRLDAADGGRRVTAFPDGSVDTYSTVFDARGDPIADREAFGDRIADREPPSFPVERDSREPGGQAPNMAFQIHALGDEPTLFGHLDDPAFAELPFESVSMGAPSEIDVFPFDDDDLLLSRPSPDVEGWSLAELEAAIERGAPDSVAADPVAALSTDGICCGNWASVEGMSAVLRRLAAAPIDGEVFVLDPGPVSARSRQAISDLLEALGALDGAVDVVYSVNRTELAYSADAIDGESEANRTDGGSETNRIEDGSETDVPTEPDGAPQADAERLASVRTAAGITAVVVHAADEATVATREGVTSVSSLDVDEPRRRSGAGDRFSAALAFGRIRDWNWEETLALGNWCAARYVETAETGDRGDLAAFLEDGCGSEGAG